MERVDRPEAERARMSLRLDSGASADDVLTAENLKMAFGDKILFEDLSFRLFKGDSAALVGPNGVGKTTLLRIVASRLTPLEGDVALGAGMKMGYYDQLQEGLCDRLSVIEELREAYPAKTDGELRNILSGLPVLRGRRFQTHIGTLGGRKGAAGIAEADDGRRRAAAGRAHNHLDMGQPRGAGGGLIGFDGTILFVSHDRYFINRVASRVLELKDGARRRLRATGAIIRRFWKPERTLPISRCLRMTG